MIQPLTLCLPTILRLTFRLHTCLQRISPWSGQWSVVNKHPGCRSSIGNCSEELGIVLSTWPQKLILKTKAGITLQKSWLCLLSRLMPVYMCACVCCVSVSIYVCICSCVRMYGCLCVWLHECNHVDVRCQRALTSESVSSHVCTESTAQCRFVPV